MKARVASRRDLREWDGSSVPRRPSKNPIADGANQRRPDGAFFHTLPAPASPGPLTHTRRVRASRCSALVSVEDGVGQSGAPSFLESEPMVTKGIDFVRILGISMLDVGYRISMLRMEPCRKEHV